LWDGETILAAAHKSDSGFRDMAYFPTPFLQKWGGGEKPMHLLFTFGHCSHAAATMATVSALHTTRQLWHPQERKKNVKTNHHRHIPQGNNLRVLNDVSGASIVERAGHGHGDNAHEEACQISDAPFGPVVGADYWGKKERTKRKRE
jgi:hypothetical protein